jgi:hypothetical protein
MSEVFAWAAAALASRGLTLSYTGLDELVAVNRANAATWLPLLPLFDPTAGGVTASTGFAFLGRNADGEVVAAQGARFYDWTGTDLLAESTSLRMFFTDPAAARARGDSCSISAPVARRITGRVVFSGAGWYRPDHRGTGLGRIVPRLSRAHAHARWNTDFTMSFMADGVLRGGYADRVGYTHVEEDTVALDLTPMGPISGALLWMPTTQLLTDLALVRR